MMYEVTDKKLQELRLLRDKLAVRRSQQCHQRSLMDEENKVNWIFHAMRLSDYKLSRQDTVNIIAGDHLVEGTIDDYMTVQNYQELFSFYHNMLEMEFDVDEKFLGEMYKLLTSSDTAPYRRTNPVLREMKYNPPHSSDVEKMMKGLNQYLHTLRIDNSPILKSVHLHCRLLQIFPFEEKNQAIAYGAMCYDLLRQGYPLLPLIIEKEQYHLIMSDFFRYKNSAVLKLYGFVVESLATEMVSLLKLSEEGGHSGPRKEI